MAEAQIADDRVNSDGRPKARQPRHAQYLPQATAGLTALDTEEDGQAGAAQPAAEAGPVVGDQRYQLRVDGVRVTPDS